MIKKFFISAFVLLSFSACSNNVDKGISKIEDCTEEMLKVTTEEDSLKVAKSYEVVMQELELACEEVSKDWSDSKKKDYSEEIAEAVKAYNEACKKAAENIR